jgi:hypothetical protein
LVLFVTVRRIAVKEQVHPVRIEPRWPAALAIIVVLSILTLLPTRIRLFPFWVTYVIGIAPFLPMAGVWLSKAAAWWLHIERVTILVFSVAIETLNITVLLYLIFNMLARPAGFSGRQLLTSSFGTWIANVLAFSTVYWMLDRGGPEARLALSANGGAGRGAG